MPSWVPGAVLFLELLFQDLNFSLHKCLFPRDGLAVAKGAIRESCWEGTQCDFSFPSRPGLRSERLLQEAGFSRKKQEAVSRSWGREGSPSVAPRPPGEQEEEPEAPQQPQQPREPVCMVGAGCKKPSLACERTASSPRRTCCCSTGTCLDVQEAGTGVVGAGMAERAWLRARWSF